MRCTIKLTNRDYLVSEARTSGCGKFVKYVFKNPTNGDAITRTVRATKKNLANMPAVGTTAPVRLAVGAED